MSLEIENPFADYGNIVTGDRFIGRKDSLRVIANRVTRPQEPGNLAIIGDPRIGKSSLVYKAVIESKSVLISKRLLPIWINLATYDQPPIFFKSLITRCIDELEDLNWMTETIQRAANHALQDEVSWSEGYTRIQRFFEKIRQNNIRILFILDEFDHARFLFKGDISGFQGLRELSYRPEWRVTFITTSRRTIREIELQSQAISTLDGIFHKHYLTMFNDEDFQAFAERLSSVGLSVTSEIIDEIEFYCGKHPYLLEMLGYEIVEVFCEQQQVNVNVAFQKIERSFVNHYDSIVYLLQEDGNLGKLLQILFGPVINVKQTDVDEFLRYGFIRLSKQGTYSAFSEHFHSFLSLVERETDLWSVWRDTEKNLRILLTSTLQDKYGSDWFSQLEKSHPNLCLDKQSRKNLFQKCRESQEREIKTWHDRASQNPLDFTYPQDLFAIILKEWQIFQPIFGRDKAYWDQRSQVISKVRNPLAHNRDDVISDYECQIAEGYCKEILQRINQYLEL
jgi:hypothetical protein